MKSKSHSKSIIQRIHLNKSGESHAWKQNNKTQTCSQLQVILTLTCSDTNRMSHSSLHMSSTVITPEMVVSSVADTPICRDKMDIDKVRFLSWLCVWRKYLVNKTEDVNLLAPCEPSTGSAAGPGICGKVPRSEKEARFSELYHNWTKTQICKHLRVCKRLLPIRMWCSWIPQWWRRGGGSSHPSTLRSGCIRTCSVKS